MTVSTRVCCSMISLTQIAYGSRVLRLGRSRRKAAYQANSECWRRATCAGGTANACCGLVMSRSPSNPGVAAVLSVIVPGVGQIYNGAFLRGVFWLIVTPGFWIGTGGMFGWVCHLIAAYTAYSYAKKMQ